MLTLEPDTRRVGSHACSTVTDEGLEISALAPGDRLMIRTAGAEYQMTVIGPRERHVLVSVDRPGPVMNAWLEGSSCDGVLVHVGAIAVGCSLELRTPAGVMVTGPVSAVSLVKRT